MNVSLKNRFRPTLDVLEDRFMPSTTVSGTVIHHHPPHPVHHHTGRTIEVHHNGAGEQEMHTGVDDTGAQGVDDTAGHHSGGHA